MYVCMQCVQFGCVVCVALVRCVDAVSLFCYVIRSLFYINKSLLLHYLVSFATLLVRCVDAVSLFCIRVFILYLICIYVCICACMCVCTYVSVYAHMYVCMYIG